MRGWLDLDRVGPGTSISDLRGDLDHRRGGAQEVGREGCLDTPLREGSGTRGTPRALPLSARSPVRAAFCAPTGLRDGAARGGEGAPLRGHQQAIVTPVPAQIVWSGSGDGHPRAQGSTNF